MIRAALPLLAALALASTASGQPVIDPAAIGKPPAEMWPTYHGDYSGQHFSPLTQLNKRNVNNLQLAWSHRFATGAQGAAFSGGTVAQPVPVVLGPGAMNGGFMKATPLYANGVLYFSAPDHVWAIDARTGREIWRYFWRTSGGEYIGNRGVAIYGDWLFVGTPDGHLLSLDAATGKERWHKQLGDVRQNYYSSAAPTVVGDKLIVGISGDALDVPGWLEARNPETGEQIWKIYTVPSRGDPGSESWPSDFARDHGGGMTWQPVTYDPALDLIYLPTGNPNPMYATEVRKGDNLYSCSIMAIDAKTGKLVWYFQTSPNEAWDFDANQVPILFDAVIDGRPRKLVAQATRNGFYFLIDRTNGQRILTAPLVESLNWWTGKYTAKGVPERIESKVNAVGGALISPANAGVQNWAPPAFSPRTNTLFLNAQQGFDIHYAFGPPEENGRLRHQNQRIGGYDASLRAYDAVTGKQKWVHRYPGSEWTPPGPGSLGGLLVTAGDVLFSAAPAGGPGGFMVARDPADGRALWHAVLPALVTNTPITFMMDGRQHVVFAANDTAYAYRLPN